MKKSFHKRIFDLRQELITSIRAVMLYNHLDNLDISNAPEPTYVVWWDNGGDLHESQVLTVMLDENRISIEVEYEGENITLYDFDFALESPVWLAGIRDNVLDTLQRIFPRGYRECSDPIPIG